MKLKNGELMPTIKFLDGMKLKGKSSLGRTKFKEEIGKKIDELTKDQKAIIDEFDGWTDKEKGLYTQKDAELNGTMDDLLNSEITVDFDSPFKVDFAAALESYDEELSGADAEVYAVLYKNLGGIENEKN